MASPCARPSACARWCARTSNRSPGRCAGPDGGLQGRPRRRRLPRWSPVSGGSRVTWQAADGWRARTCSRPGGYRWIRSAVASSWILLRGPAGARWAAGLGGAYPPWRKSPGVHLASGHRQRGGKAPGRRPSRFRWVSGRVRAGQGRL